MPTTTFRSSSSSEGRDAAGKTTIIQDMMRGLNPRMARSVALGKPSDREQREWYFQRFSRELPPKGEMAFFNRSWYNRAGVEWVMGFCTEEEYRKFLRECPDFERMLVREGFTLVKYWLSVSAEEQERRFQQWMADASTRWKFTEVAREARHRWVAYSKAKDAMMAHTDIDEAPWYVVDSEVPRHATLNAMAHLLSLLDASYVRPPIETQRMVPTIYGRSKPSD